MTGLTIHQPPEPPVAMAKQRGGGRLLSELDAEQFMLRRVTPENEYHSLAHSLPEIRSKVRFHRLKIFRVDSGNVLAMVIGESTGNMLYPLGTDVRVEIGE